MAERASLFEGEGDFDISEFAPKKNKPAPPPAAAVRDVSEKATFTSREPAKAAPKPPKAEQRRHRTGRNIQLNLKVDAETHKLFYEITDGQGYVAGETLKKALEALKRDLAGKK